jgi:hypothetical protein
MQTEENIKSHQNNIDKYIHENQYRKAFFLLVFVLENLDENGKKEMIDYYSKNIHLFDLSS